MGIRAERALYFLYEEVFGVLLCSRLCSWICLVFFCEMGPCWDTRTQEHWPIALSLLLKFTMGYSAVQCLYWETRYPAPQHLLMHPNFCFVETHSKSLHVTSPSYISTFNQPYCVVWLSFIVELRMKSFLHDSEGTWMKIMFDNETCFFRG